MQGQAGFGRLWQYNREEWPHGLMGCVGSFGLGFMMPGMAYCMSSIISVLYNPDRAIMQQEVSGPALQISHMDIGTFEHFCAATGKSYYSSFDAIAT